MKFNLDMWLNVQLICSVSNEYSLQKCCCHIMYAGTQMYSQKRGYFTSDMTYNIYWCVYPISSNKELMLHKQGLGANKLSI